nr:MAG TPA: hypothetical protein [Bacteriophage sp.]DAP08446.1 MAG TPA: hypothetical protein [Bacteriophage sp.]
MFLPFNAINGSDELDVAKPTLNFKLFIYGYIFILNALA